MKKTPPIQKTIPEVFILESLTEENEEAGLFEGRILYKTLRMAGKNPKYYYFLKMGAEPEVSPQNCQLKQKDELRRNIHGVR